MKQLLICCIALSLSPFMISAAASSQDMSPDREVKTRRILIGLDGKKVTFKTVSVREISIFESIGNQRLPLTERVATYDILIRYPRCKATRVAMLAEIKTEVRKLPSCRELARTLQATFMKQLKTSELRTSAFEKLGMPLITVCMTKVEVIQNAKNYPLGAVNEKPYNGMYISLSSRASLLTPRDMIKRIKGYLKKPNVREIVRRRKTKHFERMLKEDLFKESGVSGVVLVKKCRVKSLSNG